MFCNLAKEQNMSFYKQISNVWPTMFDRLSRPDVMRIKLKVEILTAILLLFRIWPQDLARSVWQKGQKSWKRNFQKEKRLKWMRRSSWNYTDCSGKSS